MIAAALSATVWWRNTRSSLRPGGLKSGCPVRLTEDEHDVNAHVNEHELMFRKVFKHKQLSNLGPFCT